MPGRVRITTRKGARVVRTEVFHYTVTPIPADFGRAFRLDKFGLSAPGYGTEGAEEKKSYAVNLDGARSTCECDGFLRWGMEANGGTGCKHVGACQTLVNLGKL
jgi:hypothetical protein